MKWLNTLKQFSGDSPLSFLSAFEHFVDIKYERVNWQLA